MLYNFTVTNTGNFTDQVRFLASGASARADWPGTITRAVIDVDNSGTINAGDTDILTNGADVVSANILQNGTIHVLVEVTVSAAATGGQSIQVTLGDAATGGPFIRQPGGGYFGQRSTHGICFVRQWSARSARRHLGHGRQRRLLQLTLTAPAGPVTLGSDITYTWHPATSGSRRYRRNAQCARLRSTSSRRFRREPFLVRQHFLPVRSTPRPRLPLRHCRQPGRTWRRPLNTVTRIAFPVGATLAAGATSAPFNMVVTVNTGINASIPIDEIGDAFGKNTRSRHDHRSVG